MTKKYYIEIAKIIKKCTHEESNVITKNELIFNLSVFFKKENVMFDSGKFRDACYTNKERVK